MNLPPLSLSRGVPVRLEVAATREEVSLVCDRVRAGLEGRADEAWISELDLGLTEAMTNVVRHAYAGITGGAIDLTLALSDAALEITIRDRGNAIPASVMAQDRAKVFEFDPADIDALPEGGMGIALIRMCFDGVSYASVHGVNQLDLRKRLPEI